MSLYKPVSTHECVRARAFVWAELISLATQLEATLSHAEHKAEETADRLPAAFLLYARMIWIQPDVTVKKAAEYDIMTCWNTLSWGGDTHVLVYSAVVNTDIQLVFVGLESEFYDLQKKLVGTLF